MIGNLRSDRLAPGTLLAGRYRIERELGRGGMAIVFRAQDEKLSVPVAVKLLVPGLEHSSLALERLRREAMAYSHLSHPNIVSLHEFVLEADMAFIAMELVEGPSLKQRIVLEGGLPIGEVVQIGSQIASALDAAHRLGVIHRDIKPQNVLLAAGLRVKVVDFGLARIQSAAGMTATRSTIGTPEYMAPEQIQAQPIDPRADLYSLGVLLYEALAGRPPFVGVDVFEIFQQHLSGTPRPLTEIRSDVPAWLEHVVLQCLRKRKEDRVRSAAALVEALSGDDAPTLETRALPAPVEGGLEACPRCGGPVPELVGFCLHCGMADQSSPRTVDSLMVEDKQRWERENRELLQGATRALPVSLGQRLQKRLERHQKEAIDQLEKQARDIEKLRGELELPVTQLSIDERALLLVSGRRRVGRWRRRKRAAVNAVEPLGRWVTLAQREGLSVAWRRMPRWSRRSAGTLVILSVVMSLMIPEAVMAPLFILGVALGLMGIYRSDKQTIEESRRLLPGGLLGPERIEGIRSLVQRRPSRRILEPMARLLAALAQSVRMTRMHPETIGAVTGDLSGPLCELVDLALEFGKKAALLEDYLKRENQSELEAEIERLDGRLMSADMEATEDLARLKRAKESMLLKRMDLDRQLESLLTRLSLTAAEAEDLLAALHRLSVTKQSEERRQPSVILTDLKFQLEALEELFPATPGA